MKIFTFRLQKILELRSFYEEKAKIELGRCISEVERIKNILKKIASEKIATRKNMGLKSFDFQNFLASESYLKNLDTKKEQMLKLLSEAEVKVQKARAEFFEATKKRKVLSNLKDKQYEIWKKETLQENDAVLDDIINSKVSRN